LFLYHSISVSPLAVPPYCGTLFCSGRQGTMTFWFWSWRVHSVQTFPTLGDYQAFTGDLESDYLLEIWRFFWS
jgi:hypothetical protein